MPRLNIEDSIFKDARFLQLVISVGDYTKAIGELIHCWITAQHFYLEGLEEIPNEEWVKRNINIKIIEVGLARKNEFGVHVCGQKESFEWLITRKNSGRAGGLASAKARLKLYGSAQPLITVEANSKQPEANVREIPKQTKQIEASYSSSSSYSSSISVVVGENINNNLKNSNKELIQIPLESNTSLLENTDILKNFYNPKTTEYFQVISKFFRKPPAWFIQNFNKIEYEFEKVEDFTEFITKLWNAEAMSKYDDSDKTNNNVKAYFQKAIRSQCGIK